jgi:hypothetical protein
LHEKLRSGAYSYHATLQNNTKRPKEALQASTSEADDYAMEGQSECDKQS